MRLAVVVLLIVFGMHYAADIAATAYAAEQQVRAAKAWEYVFTALGCAGLFVLVGILGRQRMAWPVCAFGAVECMERAVGRLAKPIGPPPPEVPQFSGLLGSVAFWAGLGCSLWLALELLERTKKK